MTELRIKKPNFRDSKNSKVIELETAAEHAAVLAVLGAHLGTLVAGAYEGLMHGQGKNADVPLRYIWPANMLLTIGVVKYLEHDCERELCKNQLEDQPPELGVMLFRTVAAPLEFAAGYGLGYAAGKLF